MKVDKAEEKRLLREEMRNNVLIPQGKVDDYNIALIRKGFSLDYPERVPISISRRLDNLLRNFSHACNEMPSQRLEAFFHKHGLYDFLEAYAQRKPSADLHAIRWHYSQGVISERQAMRLIKRLYEQKAA